MPESASGRRRLSSWAHASLVRLHTQVFTGAAGKDAPPVRGRFAARTCGRLPERSQSGGKGKSFSGAPFEFLPRRWIKHVVLKDVKGGVALSRPHYEPALLTTLNERLKSGDVTVAHSRRWSDFEEYLIPRSSGRRNEPGITPISNCRPKQMNTSCNCNERLHRVTAEVDRRVPHNKALTIDPAKGEFHLAALKASEKPDAIKTLKELIESRLPKVDLADVLIDIDNRTNFLSHFFRPVRIRRPPSRCFGRGARHRLQHWMPAHGARLRSERA